MRDDERDKQNRLMSLHEEFKQLLDVGASEEEDDDNMDGAANDADAAFDTAGNNDKANNATVDLQQVTQNITDDSRMVVDTTAVPSDANYAQ